MSVCCNSRLPKFEYAFVILTFFCLFLFVISNTLYIITYTSYIPDIWMTKEPPKKKNKQSKFQSAMRLSLLRAFQSDFLALVISLPHYLHWHVNKGFLPILITRCCQQTYTGVCCNYLHHIATYPPPVKWLQAFHFPFNESGCGGVDIACRVH